MMSNSGKDIWVGSKRLKALSDCVDQVLSAVRAYLPPGGISKDELISRVIYAVDNPEFNGAMSEVADKQEGGEE